MIRFILGIILCYGAVGGSDAGTLSLNWALIVSLIGICLMIFGSFNIKRHYGDYFEQ
jgi:hypothetical protein